MRDEVKRFFIYVHFRDASKTRIIESAKSLQLVMKSCFADAFKTAFFTQNSIGFFVRTAMHPNAINAALVSPDRERVRLFGDPIITGDELLILEIGDEFSVLNLGAAQGWLSAK